MVERILVFLLLIICAAPAWAQELNCRVAINADRAQTTDRQVFKDMEQSFTRFMNERQWTNDIFAPEEKIDCNLLITINSMPSVGSYTATVQIQSSRPVYNTNYETIALNYADRDWQFEYVESTPLDFSDNSFTSNLTSMLAFYAYVIIGVDYDTFSKFGGDPIFQKAQNVLNLAQSSDRPGWQAFQGNRNRYWLIDNLTNQQLRPIREAYYIYHRLGLDIFVDKPDDARNQILSAIKKVQEANRQSPNSLLKISFFDAKADEISKIYQKGSPTVKKAVYTVLVDIDPTDTEKYKTILGN